MTVLRGIKVLDLSRVLAGPYCSMLLADLGADVIKVENPEGGDDTRSWGPPFQGGESAYYLSVNRNKTGIAVDLKKPEGLEVVRRLAALSDVVLENFSPGTADRLGIGYEDAKALNPQVIYCSISGFGQDGPAYDRPAYDLLLQATGGLMGITGEEGSPPVRIGVAVLDMGAGMLAALATVSALYERATSGLGQHIDISLLDTSVSWLSYMAQGYLATGENPARLGSAHPSIVPYQAFSAKDGRYLVVAVGNDRLWERFCEVMGPELAKDPRFRTNQDRVANRSLLLSILAKRFATESMAVWVTRLKKAGVPCGPINLVSDVMADPQVLHREMVVTLDGPPSPLSVLGSPLKMSRTPGTVRMRPPFLGQDTEKVLLSLGYSGEEIRSLAQRKIISSR